MLAEAGRIRQEAASAADALVEEAQELSTQLVAESRGAAERISDDARERADGILSRARIEAQDVAERARATADAIRSKAESDIEEHRRRVRAEVTDQVTRDLTEQHRLAAAGEREQSDALISDLEASVRILGVSLESALANVTDLLGSIEELRSTPTASIPGAPTLVAPPEQDQHEGETTYADHQVAPASAVPSAMSQFRTEPEAPAPAEAPLAESAEPAEWAEPAEPEASADRPRTATEAFLSSSSLEVEQASRELRDLQHPEEARRRRGDESRRDAQRRELDEGFSGDEDDDPDPGDGTRPLGWLFRTAQ